MSRDLIQEDRWHKWNQSKLFKKSLWFFRSLKLLSLQWLQHGRFITSRRFLTTSVLFETKMNWRFRMSGMIQQFLLHCDKEIMLKINYLWTSFGGVLDWRLICFLNFKTLALKSISLKRYFWDRHLT